MNAREKRLLGLLAGILGIGVFAIGVWVWFVVPLRDYNMRILSMREENDAKQVEIRQFLADKKRVVLAKLKSLPANQNEASAEYINFLHETFVESGVTPEEITPSAAVEIKPVSNIPNVKKLGHQMMSFQVRARGTVSQLVTAMERVRNTPYEHRVKTVTIDRADNAPKDPNARLIINMTIETLLVAKTESKHGLPPGVDYRLLLADSLAARQGGPMGLGQALSTAVVKQLVPPSGDRDYADIARRNIFVGAIPKAPPPPKKPPIVKAEPPPPPPPQPPGPIPAFIRLVFVEANQEEAYYLNLFYEKDERKISAKPGAYNTFVVEAKDQSYTFFLAKVLRVDSRAVFIQIKDKVHQWNVGDTLEFATSVALPNSYMQDIDLEPDVEWGKKELEKEKNKSSTNKKKSTNPFFKGR